MKLHIKKKYKNKISIIVGCIVIEVDNNVIDFKDEGSYKVNGKPEAIHNLNISIKKVVTFREHLMQRNKEF